MFQSDSQRRRRASFKHRRRRAGRQHFRARRVGLESLESRILLTGTWTPLTNLAPPTNLGYGLAQLLSDGTVMIAGGPETNRGWQKLTPTVSGSYVNGTWSTLQSMSQYRLYDAMKVLKDGRVLVLGGNQSGNPPTFNNTNTGEIYNPLTNSWSSITPFPESVFGNGRTALLADGRVIAASISGPQTYIYNPTTDAWSAGPTKLDNDSGNHEGWIKLADGSIFTVNVNNNPGHAQRLDLSTMTWIDSGMVPVSLQSDIRTTLHLGPGVLLPDGRVIQFGNSSNTAIYTPSATPGGTGTWAAGPVVPGGLAAGSNNVNSSSCAVLLPNGRVFFCADTPLPTGNPNNLPATTRFFEFDPTAPIQNSLTDVTPSGPNFARISSNATNSIDRMLLLPSGQVLLAGVASVNANTAPANQLYVYTSDGSPDPAWKPTITSIVAGSGNTYKLTGTQLNGVSTGTYYAIGNESDSNYPIIELKDTLGQVLFARTFNWSSTGVATGSAPVTTEFTIPSNLPAGGYSLTVIANGIASDLVPFIPGPGDLNFDGHVDAADIPAMMTALANLNAYQQAHGFSGSTLLSVGDLNGDHAVTNTDLQVLIDQLIGKQKEPQLLLDINPTVAIGSSPANLTPLGNVVYFTANDGAHGAELWISDGTAAGTTLVKDINPGSAGSNPSNLITVGSTLFFTASDGASGVELWKSDGTAAGTVLVKDINPGTIGSNPGYLTGVNGTLFFRASDGASGAELWKSDGTAAGTVLVKDINPGSADSGPSNLANVNGTLFFRATDGASGVELWKSDGTAAGTLLVKDINPGSAGSYAAKLTNVNGTLFFVATEPTGGVELWKSDGTAAGTTLVKDIVPGSSGSSPGNLTNVNGTLFFAALDTTSGNELWKTDGTESGTVRVKDIAPGIALSNPNNLTAVGLSLYFTANDGIAGNELWKTDGTPAGTVLIADINAGAGSSDPGNLTIVGGTLYFSASNGISGRELWKSDGTAAGTVLIKDIRTGSASSNPSNLIFTNGTLFFTADGGASGIELWTLTVGNVVTMGPQMVADVNSALAIGSSPDNLIAIGNTLYFTANDGVHGNELWKSDGTAAGTVLVKDINPGSPDSKPQYLTNFNGTLFFSADDGVNGNELWKSDGTESGTVLVKDLQPGNHYDDKTKTFVPYSSNPYELTVAGGKLFFAGDDGVSGVELWKTDGTGQGTVLVKDIDDTANYGSYPYYLTNVNGTLYFRAYDFDHGDELWKSDGTEAGTVLVKDIFTGTYYDTRFHATYANSAFPYYLTNVNGTLYFTAQDADHGFELWKSDGTEAGTQLVKDIQPGPDGFPNSLHAVNGVLLFDANDGQTGYELWKSNGTEAGTQLVKDILPGSSAGIPSNMRSVNGTLYFSAFQATGTNRDAELFKSDGTTDGTVRIADINPGPGSSFPFGFTLAGGTVYFQAEDGTHGIELWKTDGTTAGTALVADISTFSGGSKPAQLTNINGTLFFTADDGVHGKELWKLVPIAGGGSSVPSVALTGIGSGSSAADDSPASVNVQLASAAVPSPQISPLGANDGAAAVGGATAQRHSARRDALLAKFSQLGRQVSPFSTATSSTITVAAAGNLSDASPSVTAARTELFHTILPSPLGESWGEGSETVFAPANYASQQIAPDRRITGANSALRSQLSVVDHVLGANDLTRQRRTHAAATAPNNCTVDELLASESFRLLNPEP